MATSTDTQAPDFSITARRYEVEVYNAASGWETESGDWSDGKVTSIEALETFNYHAPKPRRILKDGRVVSSQGDVRDSDHDAWRARCPA